MTEASRWLDSWYLGNYSIYKQPCRWWPGDRRLPDVGLIGCGRATLIDSLLAQDITLCVRDYHWDLPQELYDQYCGWLNVEESQKDVGCYRDGLPCRMQQTNPLSLQVIAQSRTQSPDSLTYVSFSQKSFRESILFLSSVTQSTTCATHQEHCRPEI